MLTHELNNFTIQEAVNWYPKLTSACKVWYINYNLVRARELMSFVIVYHARWRGVEHQASRTSKPTTHFLHFLNVSN